MVWLNSIFLMGQSFIPFPTALMGEYPTNRLAVSLFGCVFALNTLLFIALNRYIVRNLLKPELAGKQDPHALRKAMVGPLSYLVGAARRLAERSFSLRGLSPHAAVLHHAAVLAWSTRRQRHR